MHHSSEYKKNIIIIILTPGINDASRGLKCSEAAIIIIINIITSFLFLLFLLSFLSFKKLKPDVWWHSGKFSVLCAEGCRFESNSSHHVGTLGKSFTRSCL